VERIVLKNWCSRTLKISGDMASTDLKWFRKKLTNDELGKGDMTIPTAPSTA